jgi:hypothetical protein
VFDNSTHPAVLFNEKGYLFFLYLLTAVTFIDAVGKALLTLMAEHGAELVAVKCVTKAIVEDITRGRLQPVDSGITTGGPRSRRGNVR